MADINNTGNNNNNNTINNNQNNSNENSAYQNTFYRRPAYGDADNSNQKDVYGRYAYDNRQQQKAEEANKRTIYNREKEQHREIINELKSGFSTLKKELEKIVDFNVKESKHKPVSKTNKKGGRAIEDYGDRYTGGSTSKTFGRTKQQAKREGEKYWEHVRKFTLATFLGPMAMIVDEVADAAIKDVKDLGVAGFRKVKGIFRRNKSARTANIGINTGENYITAQEQMKELNASVAPGLFDRIKGTEKLNTEARHLLALPKTVLSSSITGIKKLDLQAADTFTNNMLVKVSDKAKIELKGVSVNGNGGGLFGNLFGKLKPLLFGLGKIALLAGTVFGAFKDIVAFKHGGLSEMFFGTGKKGGISSFISGAAKGMGWGGIAGGIIGAIVGAFAGPEAIIPAAMVGSRIGALVGALINGITEAVGKDKFVKLYHNIADWIKNAFSNAFSFAKTIIDDFGSFFKSTFGSIVTYILNALKTIEDFVDKIIEPVKETIKKGAKEVVKIGTGAYKEAVKVYKNAILPAVDWTWKGLKDLFSIPETQAATIRREAGGTTQYTKKLLMTKAPDNSIGPYQLTPQHMIDFAKKYGYNNLLKYKVGSTEYMKALSDIIDKEGAQKIGSQMANWTIENNVVPMMMGLGDIGKAIKDKRSLALDNLMFDIGNQYGPTAGASLIRNALKNVDVRNASVKQILDDVLNYRVNSVSKYFSGQSFAIQETLRDTFANQKVFYDEMADMEKAQKQAVNQIQNPNIKTSPVDLSKFTKSVVGLTDKTADLSLLNRSIVQPSESKGITNNVIQQGVGINRADESFIKIPTMPEDLLMYMLSSGLVG